MLKKRTLAGNVEGFYAQLKAEVTTQAPNKGTGTSMLDFSQTIEPNIVANNENKYKAELNNQRPPSSSLSK